jgi:hypothetical protein
MIIQITYDLAAPGRNYPAVKRYIESLGSSIRATESQWFVETARSPETIRDEVRRVTDSNDSVLVLDLRGDDWASYLPKTVNDWLNAHLSAVYR